MNQSYQVFQYISNEYWNEIGDPRVVHLPLLNGGPLPLFFVVVLYLLLVRVCNLIMTDKNALDLRLLMMTYNLLMVALNTIMFSSVFYLTDFGTQVWSCRPINRNDRSFQSMALIYCVYAYFVMKIMDFIDTIIFSLRKKKNQITFLHCFHHTVMPIICWFGLKIHPGGMTLLTPLINSFVHIPMHIYYYLSALRPAAVPYLWWKKYLTLLQLVQFSVGFIHAPYALVAPNCSWPAGFAILEATNAVIFFVMFYNFYIKSYSRKKD